MMLLWIIFTLLILFFILALVIAFWKFFACMTKWTYEFLMSFFVKKREEEESSIAYWQNNLSETTSCYGLPVKEL